MVYKRFDKKSSGANSSGSAIIQNQQLENLKNEKYTNLLKTIFGVLSFNKLLNKYNKKFRF